MDKKSKVPSLYLICLAVAVVNLAMVLDVLADIYSSRTQIFTFLDEGKLTQVDGAIDKLIDDYAGKDELHSSLLIIADSLTWRRLYDRAEQIYQYILDESTGDSFAARANLGVARLKVLRFIRDKRFSDAQKHVNLMVISFRDEPDLAVALFQIGQEFGWFGSYIEAQKTFDSIFEIQPNSSLAQEVKLWSARADICSLIKDGKDEQTFNAIEKLINDFEYDSRLPETLYWISKQYEWTKAGSQDRTGWYDEPNNVYQRMIEQFNDSSYGQEAVWDQKRLMYRIKIFNLIDEGDQSKIDSAVESMVTEFSGRPEFAGELRWIAWGYEEREKIQQSKRMFERIIKEYPGTPEADNAVLDIRRLDIWQTFKNGNEDKAEVLINNFIADFKQHPYAGDCLGGISFKFHIIAAEQKLQGNEEEMKKCLNMAINIWKRVIEELPPSNNGTPDALFYSGVCYSALGRKEEAAACFQKVADDWPDYRFVQEARVMSEPGVKNATVIKR